MFHLLFRSCSVWNSTFFKITKYMVHKNEISSPCTFWRMLLVISQYKAMYLYKTVILAKACLLPQMRYQLACAGSPDTPVCSAAEFISTHSLHFSCKHTVSTGHTWMDIDVSRDTGLKDLFKVLNSLSPWGLQLI